LVSQRVNARCAEYRKRIKARKPKIERIGWIIGGSKTAILPGQRVNPVSLP
jgi:hypothetical protein